MRILFLFSLVFLIKLTNAQNQVWNCLMCKESDYKGQCGEVYQSAPLKVPTILCSEACVSFKNIYDGGRKRLFHK